MKRKFLTLFFILTMVLHAESFFQLNNLKSLSIVTELQSNKVDPSYKNYINDEIHKTVKELDIKIDKYHQRALALIVTHTYTGETFVLNSELVLGENVERIDDKEKVYAFTYLDRESTPIDDPGESEAVEEALEDAVDALLGRFADQFREDNRLKPKKVIADESSFSDAMRYETDYGKALKKAKKEGKNLMLVLSTEYCPWCRKFEKNVLQKEEVNQAVHAKYVPVILNRDKKAFPAKFTSTFTPVVYFIDAKSEEVRHKIVGYNQREEFLHLLKH